MKRIISAILLLILCCTLLTGCFCKHEWQDATCTTPTTCTLCGKTEGEAHGHMAGEMVTGEIDIFAKTSVSYQNCKICGESLHSETTTLTSVVSSGKFIFTPNQFNDALASRYVGDYDIEVDALDSGALVTMIYNAGGSLTGAIMYLSDDNESLTADDADSAKCTDLLCYWYTSDNAEIIDIMTVIFMASDISLTSDTALDVFGSVLDSYESGSYRHNDLSYEVTLNDGDFVFLISAS